jgi:WD40 repeat protein
MEMDLLATRQFTFPRSGEFEIHWQVAARSPDGSRIACSAYASDKSACVTKVFDRATLTEIYSLETLHKSDLPGVRSIAWSPDGRYLATATFDGVIDGYVIVWEMTTGKEVVKLKQQGPVDSVAWSPDGTRVASSSWNQIVKTWEVGTWRELLTLNCHPGVRGRSAGGEHKVVWTPDGSRLGAGTMLGWVIMWDANTGRELLSFKAHTAAIRSIAISPDGLRIATASRDKSVKIWDMAGRQLLTLRGHDVMVNSVAWSPSGTWLISSGGDGLRIWGARSSTALSTSAAASTSSAWP